MLRSILVGLDGSANSDAAAEWGVRWAKELGAKLVGIGIIDQPAMSNAEPLPPAGDRDPQMEGRWEHARRRVEEYLEQFSQRCVEAGVAATALQDVGRPYERILRESQRHDIIVSTQHFETRESAGDTFTQVLQSAPRPVVSVPGNLPKGSEIVVAFDSSPQSSRAVQAFVATGIWTSTTVHVVTIDSDVEVAMRQSVLAADFLRLHDVNAQVRPLGSTDPPAQLLLREVADLDAGLLVIGTHKKPLLKEVFLGSVTKTILNESTVPLFLYH